MVKLSVNLDKIALLRNSRAASVPSPFEFAKLALAAGADGITMHPRPDLRHILSEDAYSIKKIAGVELNLEGNPFSTKSATYEGFINIVKKARPYLVTLVPDEDQQLTSDHGWNLPQAAERLKPLISEILNYCPNVSLFVEPDCEQLNIAVELGANRIELYTESLAKSFGAANFAEVWQGYERTAVAAKKLNLRLNAGHDLSLENIPEVIKLTNLHEVSIGFALTNDALIYGFSDSVRKYKQALNNHP